MINNVGRRPITLNINTEVLKQFSEYCKERGMLPSRRIEILIANDLKVKE